AGAGAGGGSGSSGGAGGGGGGAGGSDVLDAFLRSPQAMHVAVTQDVPQRVRIIRGFSNNTGQPCRVVEQTVVINGQRVRASGTLCQETDGRWTIAPRGQP